MELLAVDAETGIEYTRDMLGNAGAFMDYIEYDSDDDIHVIAQDDYDWWAEYITNYKSDEKEINEFFTQLEDKYSWDEVEEIKCSFFSEISDSEYDSHHYWKQQALADFRKKCL